MTTFNTRRSWASLRALGLPALTIALGLQILRVFLPAIVYVYGERPGVTSADMGVLAFAVFLLAFLAAVLRRLLGPRNGLGLTAGVVAIVRLAIQLSPSPGLNLLLSALGTVGLALFFPMYLGHTRARGPEATGNYGLGLLLGLAIDTALHGAFLTYDLSRQPGLLPLLLVLILAALQLTALARELRHVKSRAAGDARFAAALPFLALGPALFLQMQLFQNVAHLTAVSGWRLPLAFGWIILVNTGALATGVAAIRQARRNWWPGTLILGAIVTILLPAMERGGPLAAIVLLLGHVGVAGLLTLILVALGYSERRPGLWRTTVVNGIGMLLFVAIAFAYYVSYDQNVPYSNAILAPIGAGILAMCAAGAARSLPADRQPTVVTWTPALAGLVLVVLPLGLLAAWHSPQPTTGQGWPAGAMTYNLHQGFDVQGRLDMEALARVIEENNSDVVALQEVSRGWIINGSLDMLTWLSRRLDMPYVFGPAADPVWGNAILSRYPIRESGNTLLPRGGVPMKRGYLWARIDLGAGEELLFIAAHLHHLEPDSHVRQPQVAAILDFWAGQERTVLLGDFNAEPDALEIEKLRSGGMVDVWARVSDEPGYTFRSDHPHKRIDYIWLSPDLRPLEAVVPATTASDHLPVVATVER